MAVTYTPLATTTLTSTQASISFGSISSAYSDLRVVLVGSVGTSGNGYVRFNSDANTNYSATAVVGDNTNATTARTTSATEIAFTTPSIGGFTTAISSYIIDIIGYAGSTFKTCFCSIAADKNGIGAAGLITGMWRSTTAISTVDVFSGASNFAVGTTATLYGILKA